MRQQSSDTTYRKRFPENHPVFHSLGLCRQIAYVVTCNQYIPANFCCVEVKKCIVSIGVCSMTFHDITSLNTPVIVTGWSAKDGESSVLRCCLDSASGCACFQFSKSLAYSRRSKSDASGSRYVSLSSDTAGSAPSGKYLCRLDCGKPTKTNSFSTALVKRLVVWKEWI